MSIQHHPDKEPLMPPPPLQWGELAADKKERGSVRFVLADRVVTFPLGQIKRWEHVAGNPETMVITAGKELVRVEGQQLTAIRIALDESCLRELRTNGSKPSSRDGPVVRRLTIEPA
jgi:hypothetical protein